MAATAAAAFAANQAAEKLRLIDQLKADNARYGKGGGELWTLIKSKQ